MSSTRDQLLRVMRLARQAIEDAEDTCFQIIGDSQFCTTCSACERATEWRNKYNGGSLVLDTLNQAILDLGDNRHESP